MHSDPDATSKLPPGVLDLVRRGRKIEAIKLLRETTGLGLKEAKDVVDALQVSGGADSETVGNRTVHSDPDAASNLPPGVLDAVRRGRKIEAIKLLRETTGVGLKEAKDVVDALQTPGGAGRTTVQRGGGGTGWIVLALIAALAAGLAWLWLAPA